MNKLLTLGLLLFAGLNQLFAQSDLCAGAPLLPVGTGCSGTSYTLNGAWGAELPSPSCGTNFRDGFYRFVATSTTTTIDLTDGVGGPDPILAIYSGVCGALTQIGCSNNGNNVNESVTVTTVVGTTYYVAIMRNNNAAANAITGQVCVYQGAAIGPNVNCSAATQVCNTSSFSGNANGFGNQELNAGNQGCLSGENQSSWYYFQALTSGTVEFTIVTTADYDFALWGTNCGALGAPIRCSFAGTFGNTGLQAGAGQNSEGAGGDGFVNALPVTAGQTYILLVDNYSVDNTPFNLNWNFSGGATLNCTPVTLPVEFLDFIANYKPEKQLNQLDWSTASERFNDYFTIERSIDGVNWEKVATPDAVGNSIETNDYSYFDQYFIANELNYYRLSQTDTDGNSSEFLKIVAVDNRVEMKEVVKRINLLGQEVSADEKGLVILIFDDNTTLKVYQ